ncbi:hypothetical protein ALC53_00661 [Atta colombica]|uniref:Uncharacterized protein n=1 Tax=Atta colombica TaxID=520822 RepID=A0A195BVR5_9HYME|nr:hypothetical protein ALC53_00661 [Atta colombica]
MSVTSTYWRGTLFRGIKNRRIVHRFLTAATFLSTYYQKHFLLLQCNP